MRIGCAEFAVPGRTLWEKLEFLERQKLWLELANDGAKTLKDVKSLLANYRVEIRSLQAYRQHELNLLAKDESERKAAKAHIEETIRFAGEIGAGNVVVVTGYGAPGVIDPRKVLKESLKEFSQLGEEIGVTIGLEPLGAKTSFLPRVGDVAGFLKELSLANIRIVMDTMHTFSAGDDPTEVFKENSSIIAEIQLRDTESRAPGRGEIEFKKLGKLLNNYRGLVCLEYRPGENPERELLDAVSFVNGIISEAR
ncbi:MAG: sugar phosphate isomerase/epimerase [Candidatus Hadarchaeales archaeon]